MRSLCNFMVAKVIGFTILGLRFLILGVRIAVSGKEWGVIGTMGYARRTIEIIVLLGFVGKTP